MTSQGIGRRKRHVGQRCLRRTRGRWITVTVGVEDEATRADVWCGGRIRSNNRCGRWCCARTAEGLGLRHLNAVVIPGNADHHLTGWRRAREAGRTGKRRDVRRGGVDAVHDVSVSTGHEVIESDGPRRAADVDVSTRLRWRLWRWRRSHPLTLDCPSDRYLRDSLVVPIDGESYRTRVRHALGY